MGQLAPTYLRLWSTVIGQMWRVGMLDSGYSWRSLLAISSIFLKHFFFGIFLAWSPSLASNNQLFYSAAAKVRIEPSRPSAHRRFRFQSIEPDAFNGEPALFAIEHHQICIETGWILADRSKIAVYRVDNQWLSALAGCRQKRGKLPAAWRLSVKSIIPWLLQRHYNE